MSLNIGDKVPNFSLATDGGGKVTLSDLQGQKVVVYFYPKDSTPGCTREACSFRDYKKNFDKMNTFIIGVSKDSPQSHDKFKKKEGLNFVLASDETGEVCESFGVWVEKSMYGRKYFGIERSTFLINEEGKIEKIWRKVKVPGHIEEVLETIKN